MNMLRENMRLIAECSQQLVSLGENLWGKGTTEEDVSFDTEYECLKHEITLPKGYIFKDENGNVINATKIVLKKKKKEYPKTYEECCEIIHSDPKFYVDTHLYSGILGALYRLLVCRDAYWKIAGEEMGLGRPWSPSDNNKKPIHAITRYDGYIIKDESGGNDEILEFPTEEMRDAFYENFKKEIEICKELL